MTGPVTRNDFLRAWLLQYLPLIRGVPVADEHQAWLAPAELARVRRLAGPGQDPDDVPFAVLALLLEAFFLSEDGKPLRAVYGDADLSGHHNWVDILKAGGDAGQLGKTLTMAGGSGRRWSCGMASISSRAALAGWRSTGPTCQVPATSRPGTGKSRRLPAPARRALLAC